MLKATDEESAPAPKPDAPPAAPRFVALRMLTYAKVGDVLQPEGKILPVEAAEAAVLMACSQAREATEYEKRIAAYSDPQS